MAKSLKKSIIYILVSLSLTSVAIFSTKVLHFKALKIKEQEKLTFKNKKEVNSNYIDNSDFEISYNDNDLYEEQKFLSVDELR